MPGDANKIRESRISPIKETITWLPMDHRAVAVLRCLGVIIAGVEERPGNSIWGEGVTDSTLLFLVVEGSVTSLADSPRVEAVTGECLVVPAGRTKRLQCGPTPLRAVWLHLANIQLWQHLLGATRVHHPLEQPLLLPALMESLITETFTNSAATVLGTCMAETFAEFLARNFGIPETASERTLKLRLHELWQSVAADLAHDWTVAKLAAGLHVSIGHLHRVVRRLNHDHPMRIVTRLRLQRAAGYLLATHETLESIAERTGYKTAYALSNAFLREMGIRPGKYRLGLINASENPEIAQDV